MLTHGFAGAGETCVLLSKTEARYVKQAFLNQRNESMQREGRKDLNAQIFLVSLFADLVQLLDARRFSLFYRFVFFICRERGQKSLRE